MPTYEYICSKCGHEFDVFQRITEPALKVCPKDKCKRKTWGKGAISRGIGAGAGLIFKGTGFYITDYRSEKYKEAAKKDSASGGAAPASDGKSKAETKSESKPAAKPEAKKTGSGNGAST